MTLTINVSAKTGIVWMGCLPKGRVFAMSGYAGDISVIEAWKILQSEPESVLVDVRTRAEWQFVGVPELAGIGKEVLFVEWQTFPSGKKNPDFTSELAGAEAAGTVSKEGKVLFLCRSGARSRSAAKEATSLGFANSYNISGGFEGDLDTDGHRSLINGWKHVGLPWRQT